MRNLTQATIAGACELVGCTDPMPTTTTRMRPSTRDVNTSVAPLLACNYDDGANVDDDSCEYESCGCLNEDACNYDEDAIYSGFCEFPDDGFDCDGICLDDDEDGVCNFDEVSGCNDPDAINFNDDVIDDDGSCIEAVPGCTIEGAQLRPPRLNDEVVSLRLARGF